MTSHFQEFPLSVWTPPALENANVTSCPDRTRGCGVVTQTPCASEGNQGSGLNPPQASLMPVGDSHMDALQMAPSDRDSGAKARGQESESHTWVIPASEQKTESTVNDCSYTNNINCAQGLKELIY